VSDELDLDIEPRVAATLPSWPEMVTALRKSPKPRAADVLRGAASSGKIIIQPRCGVGDHEEMRDILLRIEAEARPAILTLTIDSYTRLKQFRTAAQALSRDPRNLNGYPLVTHGWRRGRELDDAVQAPLEVRHGSPDPRELFAVALAAGLTSFEGGGISYNLPYSKNVPLRVSLSCWQQVDQVCGELAKSGIIVDRELFGTLTAVLMPPSVSLAVSMLEAVAASAAGVQCLSVAYPQSGEIHQDIAALRSIPVLARRYLPESIEIYPTLHEFMGVFPRQPEAADALILFGGLTARLGGATKVINKTCQEAYGIPDAAANIDGIRLTALAQSELLDFIQIDEATVEEELYWLQREVCELVDPVLNDGETLSAIVAAFESGRMDIPFSASVHARAEVVPKRDASGAIRYLHPGRLPFSRLTLRHNEQRLGLDRQANQARLVQQITADINHFLRLDSDDRRRVASPLTTAEGKR
jgi:methylaspartate mutase epsilon subunit